MLLEIVHPRWAIRVDIDQICDPADDADNRDRQHQRLSDHRPVARAVRPGHDDGDLHADMPPMPQQAMLRPERHHRQPVPDQADRQDRQIEHHPAEQAGDQRRIGQSGMGAEWVRECAQTHPQRRTGGGEDAIGEDLAGLAVVEAALAADHRHPEQHQSDRARADMGDDEKTKQRHGSRRLAFSRS